MVGQPFFIVVQSPVSIKKPRNLAFGLRKKKQRELRNEEMTVVDEIEHRMPFI
jgi:hypothetical protein